MMSIKTGARRWAGRRQRSQPVNLDRLLRRSEAAAYLTDRWGIPIASRTLANKAVLGGGPVYLKVGPFVLYEIPDLDSWAQSRITKRRSTSEIIGDRADV